MDKKYKGRYVYHLTSIDNLDSIIKHGLLATNVKKRTVPLYFASCTSIKNIPHILKYGIKHRTIHT